MKNFNQQTIADSMEVPAASIVSFYDFNGPDDKDLGSGKEWVLVDRDNREWDVIYICPRTGSFLCRARLSKTNSINPLEFKKDGKFSGINRRYDIIGKRRTIRKQLAL